MDNLKNIFSAQKQIGTLIGAGVSKVCGLPNIIDLTNSIMEELKKNDNDYVKNFLAILSQHEDNIEKILNKVSNLKNVISSALQVNNLTCDDIEKIDDEIKQLIYKKLTIEIEDIQVIKDFIIWLNFNNNEYQKEIFTLNYDTLFERAFEEIQIPYFNGFIGSVKPFFFPDSVENMSSDYVKSSWTKLWKIHGSLNFKKDKNGVIHIDNSDDGQNKNNLLIYPSMDKYISSRKTPYISYLDRFRKYLLEGEKTFITLGYSFSDEHVNEILINGLSNNPKLSLIIFAYDKLSYDSAKKIVGLYPNASIYSGNYSYINKIENENFISPIGNLGDFNVFVNMINSLTGVKKEEVISSE